MRSNMILLTVLLTLLSGCALYTIEYVAETYDAEGNVIAQSSAKGRAFVANTSDEVSFRMQTDGDSKDIEFGKTNTGAEAQVQAIQVVSDRLACIAAPATCALGR